MKEKPLAYYTFEQLRNKKITYFVTVNAGQDLTIATLVHIMLFNLVLL